jgi:hypothetical protein
MGFGSITRICFRVPRSRLYFIELRLIIAKHIWCDSSQLGYIYETEGGVPKGLDSMEASLRHSLARALTVDFVAHRSRGMFAAASQTDLSCGLPAFIGVTLDLIAVVIVAVNATRWSWSDYHLPS